jgi:hypothetical protein
MLKYLAKMPQCSVAHQLLPREQWTKPEEVGYTEASQLVARTNNELGRPVSLASYSGDRV